MCKYKRKFLEKALLGRTIRLDNSKEVISQCIRLAYRDMMTAGRFYYLKKMDEIKEDYILILEKVDYIYSRDIIKEVCSLFGAEEEIRNSDNGYATRYGLAQKIVNMSYKYFYIFSDYIDEHIDFSKCDCPIDSVIIGKLNLKYKWSKLTEQDYIKCQDIIAERLKEEVDSSEIVLTGNLTFDLIYW